MKSKENKIQSGKIYAFALQPDCPFIVLDANLDNRRSALYADCTTEYDEYGVLNDSLVIGPGGDIWES